jgi:hypothetical protein
MSTIEKLERIACTSRLPNKAAVRRAESLCAKDESGAAKMLLRHIRQRHAIAHPFK